MCPHEVTEIGDNEKFGLRWGFLLLKAPKEVGQEPSCCPVSDAFPSTRLVTAPS